MAKTSLSAPPGPPAVHPVGAQRWVPWAMLLVLAVFFALMTCFWVPAYHGGVDEASYFLTARGLASRGDPAVYNLDPLAFVPENMVETRPGVFYQKYPIGFPLLVAAGQYLAGATGAFLVNPLCGLLLVLGTMLLARDLIGPWAGVLAGSVMALHPLVVFYATGSLSHASDACMVVWGLWCLWRWGRSGGVGYALGAGALLGFAASIRYTDVLLGLVAAWVLAWRLREAGWKHTVLGALLMAAAGLAALAPLLIYQAVAFGSPWTSGYALTAESSSFSWHWFWSHLGYVLWSLNALGYGLPVLVPLAGAGLVGVLIAVVRGQSRAAPMAGFLGLWVLPTVLLYTSYYWITMREPTLFLRFFVAVFPGLVIGALAVLELLSRRGLWWQLGVSAAVLALSAAGWQGTVVSEQMGRTVAQATLNDAAARLVRGQVPAGALVLGDYWTCYYLAYAGDYRLLYPRYFDAGWVGDRLKTMEGPGPWDFNRLRAERLAEAVGGRTQEQLDGLLRQKVLGEARGGRPVFLVTMPRGLTGQERRREQWEKRLGPGAELRELGREPYGFVVYQVVARP